MSQFETLNINNDDIEEIIIQMLEDHGYTGIELLNKLSSIYQTYQQQHIKNWQIEDINKFASLKDTIWFNFEHKIHFDDIEKAYGIHTLQYLGTRFPALTHLFDDSSLIEFLYLPLLLEEIDQVIELWKADSDIYLAEIYVNDENIDIKGGQKPSEIIIHRKTESPVKYKSDCVNRPTSILDANGNKQILQKKEYVFCMLTGPINKYEQNSIYFNLLVDLRDTITSAIQYHKDVQLILTD